MRKKSIYSVGQVNHYIKNLFAQDFLLGNLSVKGEVSNCKYHSSGHIYFTLKDAGNAMSCIMFAGNRKGLNFRMQEGDNVIVTGSVEVYERDGKYQMYARSIELDGIGALYVKYEQLKKELEEMGMFAAEYKQPIPAYARTIGVVTAPTGAAVHDIRTIAARRNDGVQLILYPALVQGQDAPQSIVNGIHALEQYGVDVMIVGRGGGSIEDLWAFNEEIVARAVFECSVPVISAVGHETDFTIIDYVADLRAPTPSAAAELAVWQKSDVKNRLDLLRDSYEAAMYNRLESQRQRCDSYAQRLRYLSPSNRLNQKRQYLMELENRLQLQMEKKLYQAKGELERLAVQLDGVSPLKKLSSGYACLEHESGGGVRSFSDVEIGERLTMHLLEGDVYARVEEKKERADIWANRNKKSQ